MTPARGGDGDQSTDEHARWPPPCPASGSRAASAGPCAASTSRPCSSSCPRRASGSTWSASGPKGEIWIVECKSSRADFVSDLKWGGYLEWCDRFFWAVDADFPADLLPSDAGLILADPYDAEIQRWPEPAPLAGARRRALTQRFARTAAGRLGALLDPDAVARVSG